MATDIEKSWKTQLDEASTLAQLEKLVERSFKSAMLMAAALHKIKKNGLYKSKHETWNEYCEVRWGHTARWGNSLIEMADSGQEPRKGGPSPRKRSYDTGNAKDAAEDEEVAEEPLEEDSEDRAACVVEADEEGEWDEVFGSVEDDRPSHSPQDGDPRKAMKALGELRRFASAVAFYEKYRPTFDTLERFIRGYIS